MSAIFVCSYTVTGGMWSLSMNDAIQSCVIMLSLIGVTYYAYNAADARDALPSISFEDRTYWLYPRDRGVWVWFEYFSAWIAIGFGSIPGQDMFQRVVSARSAKIAQYSAYFSAALYLVLGLLPIIITQLMMHAFPDLHGISTDKVLIYGIQKYSGVLIQTLFFGALLSAIMSSASGGLIAVAVTISENMIRPLRPHWSDAHFLRSIRISIIIVCIISVLYASSNPKIYALLLDSASITTATQFMPMFLGLYLKNIDTRHAVCSSLTGFFVWALCLYGNASASSAFLGVLASAIGFFIPYCVDWVKPQRRDVIS
jgi:Na+/proline symporter